tara:strand:- start:150 stop:383 length:234 start_codon:yes stop_codon:yes gene_type:complete
VAFDRIQSATDYDKSKDNMNFESNFLTNYGLQNYVSFSRSNGANVFSIKGTENPKMIGHARIIISEMYRGTSTIIVN